ncbi:MAG: polysaccharide biosynthesis/export family protein [Planctomycetes bacterium]|nr:polysaccharide biosynthesis/export family protein [Planctomycetota bacterium]
MRKLRLLTVCRSLLALALCAGGTGCSLMETANSSSNRSTPLALLTNWVSQPIEVSPGFDVEEIKPANGPATVAPQNVLEVTVWDLYEPGRPHTFPVRVSENLQIEVPLLGQVSVENRTIPQVEAALVEGYHQGEFLLDPRVIVRSLDAATVKVHVKGAVNRPGYVELNRADRSAYAAILSAGGLSKMAGTQVAITRAPNSSKAEPAGSHERRAGHLGDRADDSLSFDPSGRSHPPQSAVDPALTRPEETAPRLDQKPAQRANMAEDVSVSQVAPAPDASALRARGLFSVPHTESDGDDSPGQAPAAFHNSEPTVRGVAASAETPTEMAARHLPTHHASRSAPEPDTVWYDVSLARDRDGLKAIELSEGDVVTVKPAAQPLRMSGIVMRPGEYPLPPGRSLNVWQAIELAGGVQDVETPVKITVSRPATEGHSARHWQVSVPAYAEHPTASPLVEPGDELHIEPTTGSKIKRVVRNVWSKP